MKPGVGTVEEAHAGHLETMLAYVDGQALDRQETFHEWEAELPPDARAAFAGLKDSAAIRASILEAFPGNTVHNVSGMNEVYVSNMGAKGSDRAFLQQHIDGPFGLLPFVTLLRCLVVVRGNDRVTTVFAVQKARNTLRTGEFCWLDYNRDIHHIVKSGDPDDLLADSRICLKVHYAVVPRWLAPVRALFAGWNETYNRRARELFVASKNPQSAIGKLLGAVVNAGTFLYPLFFQYVGVLNLLVLLLFWGVTAGHPTERVYLFSFVHYALYAVAHLFRTVEPGRFARDATLFQLVALGTLFWQYGQAGFDAPSLAVAALGFGLSGLAFLRLGSDRTYFGAELGVVPPGKVSGFPYGVIPHPMIVGKLVGFAGLALHAPFRAAWWPLLLAHVACYVVVLCQEVAGRHLGDTYRFEETYRDFARFHQKTGNVVVHLFSTGIGLLGVFGLVGAAALALGATPAVVVAFVAVLYAYFCAYTAPDQTALASILYVAVVLAAYLALPTTLGWLVAAGLLVLGTVAQDVSHIVFRERTYMSSYQRGRGAVGLFVLHTVLLVPLLCRAAFFRTAVTARAA